MVVTANVAAIRQLWKHGAGVLPASFQEPTCFLCPQLQRTQPDDIIAKAFLESEDNPIDAAGCDVPGYEKVRLDKMLAHLSSKRENFIDAGAHSWPVAKMLFDVLAHLEGFFSKLSTDRREWFIPAAEMTHRKARAVELLEVFLDDLSTAVVVTHCPATPSQ